MSLRPAESYASQMADRDTIPDRLLRQAASHPSKIAYHTKLDGRWQPTTWQTYATQVRTAARALITLGFPPRGKVAILGFNRPEWTILILSLIHI